MLPKDLVNRGGDDDQRKVEKSGSCALFVWTLLECARIFHMLLKNNQPGVWLKRVLGNCASGNSAQELLVSLIHIHHCLRPQEQQLAFDVAEGRKFMHCPLIVALSSPCR